MRRTTLETRYRDGNGEKRAVQTAEAHIGVRDVPVKTGFEQKPLNVRENLNPGRKTG